MANPPIDFVKATNYLAAKEFPKDAYAFTVPVVGGFQLDLAAVPSLYGGTVALFGLHVLLYNGSADPVYVRRWAGPADATGMLFPSTQFSHSIPWWIDDARDQSANERLVQFFVSGAAPINMILAWSL